ncbi:MAG: coiled-coil domain-containing protein [Candidatus Binatia bacterium]
MRPRLLLGALVLVLLASDAHAQATRMTAEEKIKELQQQMLDMQSKMQEQMATMQREMEALKAQQQQELAETKKQQAEGLQQVQTAQEEFRSQTLGLLDRVKLEGYGSFRYDNSSLDNLHSTFTFRRVVLTTDAKIAPRLRFYLEVEYERFRKLELERSVKPEDEGLELEQAIEGTDGSELAIEQAWFQYDLTDWLSLRGGAVLVPVGRFNLHHDDNLWNLPRRSLVDRGAPVLPSTSAWDELGVGFIGKTRVGENSELDYQLYVLNGVSLDAELEDIVLSREETRGKLKAEVKLSPSTGTFNNDSKSAKSLAGRLNFSPFPGHELAGSFYWGRYTPQFLSDEQVWSLGFDGLTHVGPIDLEWQYVFTRFGGIKNVARSFAKVVKDHEVAVEEDVSPTLETELEFELANLSRTKHGYWLEARYPFWLEGLNDTFLGRTFTNPQFIPVVRMEQVWFPSLLEEADFEDGVLTEFKTASRFVHRVTAGFAYVPTPLVRFTLAYEYAWTNNGKSHAGVTNYLPAKDGEDHAGAFFAGMSVGF